MSIYRFTALLFGICLIVLSLTVSPITIPSQAVDFITLAHYVAYLHLSLFGNLLIWVAILTQPK